MPSRRTRLLAISSLAVSVSPSTTLICFSLYSCSKIDVALRKSRNMPQITSATSLHVATVFVFSVQRAGFGDLQHHCPSQPPPPLTHPSPPTQALQSHGRPVCSAGAGGETILRAEKDEFSARRRQDDNGGGSEPERGRYKVTHQPIVATPVVGYRLPEALSAIVIINVAR